MASCKDCLHLEACTNVFRFAFPNSADLNIEPVITQKNNCKLFKNKDDVAEVKHGHWKPIYEMLSNKYETVPIATRFECSECGSTRNDEYNYCPLCGAKMISESEVDTE